ncbi:MAG: outer membrane lipoprotein-sorting protein [Candidatus Acidiferrales bacterium]
MRRLTVMVFMFVASLSTAALQSHGTWTLESVLKQLDGQAHDFHSLAADVERTKVTVVVNDKSTETGTILVHGEKMRLELKAPDARTILRNGDNFYIYTPGLKRVEEYNVGKHRTLVDQFLLLGFGTPGRELQKGYLMTFIGETTLDNRKVVQLELTPKSDEVRNQISKIELWVDESIWLPLQQQFFETGTQDYFIIRYSNIVRNAHIQESEFKPHWPKGTEKVKPQG